MVKGTVIIITTKSTMNAQTAVRDQYKRSTAAKHDLPYGYMEHEIVTLITLLNLVWGGSVSWQVAKQLKPPSVLTWAVLGNYCLSRTHTTGITTAARHTPGNVSFTTYDLI